MIAMFDDAIKLSLLGEKRDGMGGAAQLFLLHKVVETWNTISIERSSKG
jgi:hypothetical protein